MNFLLRKAINGMVIMFAPHVVAASHSTDVSIQFTQRDVVRVVFIKSSIQNSNMYYRKSLN